MYSACKCKYYFSLFLDALAPRRAFNARNTFHFSLSRALFEPLNRVLVLDDLDCALLCSAGGYELEGGFVAEVLEVLAGCPADVHLLDVGGGEGIGRLGAFGVELHVEAAELPEVDLVAKEHLFAQAVDGFGEHGCDVGTVVGAAVVGDVFGELVDAEDFVYLSGAVGLGLGDVLLLRTRSGGHDDDTVVDHDFFGLRIKD